MLILIYFKIKCRALSAAIFDGDWNRTGDEWPAVGWSDQWAFMTKGELDVSTSQATYNMERDVLQVCKI